MQKIPYTTTTGYYSDDSKQDNFGAKQGDIETILTHIEGRLGSITRRVCSIEKQQDELSTEHVYSAQYSRSVKVNSNWQVKRTTRRQT